MKKCYILRAAISLKHRQKSRVPVRFVQPFWMDSIQNPLLFLRFSLFFVRYGKIHTFEVRAARNPAGNAQDPPVWCQIQCPALSACCNP